jgi:hypothetical protein
MGGTTPTLALPYPVAADTADVPRDIKALADKLDASILVPGCPIVSALPGSPVDGQQVILRPIEGQAWHCIYNADSPNAQKWEVAGGTSMFYANATAEAIPTGAAWKGLTTPAKIDVPVLGVYEVDMTMAVQATAGAPGNAVMGIGSVAVPTPTTLRSQAHYIAGLTQQVQISMNAEFGLGPPDSFQIVIHPATMTLTAVTRTLRARPVRL